jgi:hypothetical protein
MSTTSSSGTASRCFRTSRRFRRGATGSVHARDGFASRRVGVRLISCECRRFCSGRSTHAQHRSIYSPCQPATLSTPTTCDQLNSIKFNKRWNLVRDQGSEVQILLPDQSFQALKLHLVADESADFRSLVNQNSSTSQLCFDRVVFSVFGKLNDKRRNDEIIALVANKGFTSFLSYFQNGAPFWDFHSTICSKYSVL